MVTQEDILEYVKEPINEMSVQEVKAKHKRMKDLVYLAWEEVIRLEKILKVD